MLSVAIRPARVEDARTIYELLHASAVEQSSPDHLCVDEQAIREDGFGTSPRFQALIAECDGRPAGLALFFFTYATWTSRNGLYLEDLCVDPAFRRRGVARALMERLKETAIERGCRRFQWVVRRDNAAAIQFYESLGATELSEWSMMWMRLT